MTPSLATQRGFTLLEVVVALLLLAVALAAASSATGSAANSNYTLKTRLLATWVAQNRLAEQRLRKNLPDVGEQSGEAEQGGTRFTWREKVSNTENTKIRRIEINVARLGETDYNAATLVGYLAAFDQANSP